MIREVIVDLCTLVFVKVPGWVGDVRYRARQMYVSEETLQRYL